MEILQQPIEKCYVAMLQKSINPREILCPPTITESLCNKIRAFRQVLKMTPGLSHAFGKEVRKKNQWSGASRSTQFGNYFRGLLMANLQIRKILLSDFEAVQTARESDVKFARAPHHKFDNVHCGAILVDESEEILA